MKFKCNYALLKLDSLTFDSATYICARGWVSPALKLSCSPYLCMQNCILTFVYLLVINL